MERNHGGGIDCPQCQSHLSCKSAFYRHLRVVHDKTTKMVGYVKSTVLNILIAVIRFLTLLFRNCHRKNRKTVSVPGSLVPLVPKISATKDLGLKDHARPLSSSSLHSEMKTEVRKNLKIRLKMSDVYHDQYRIAN